MALVMVWYNHYSLLLSSQVYYAVPEQVAIHNHALLALSRFSRAALLLADVDEFFVPQVWNGYGIIGLGVDPIGNVSSPCAWSPVTAATIICYLPPPPCTLAAPHHLLPRPAHITSLPE